jgi:N-acetylglutamate synthase
MQPSLRAMTFEDYPAVLALWQATEGMGLSRADAPEAIRAYLERNPGLSLVAHDDLGELVGAVLCGHDGRRGMLHHLAVHPGWRKRGLGRALVRRCLAGLAAAGIDKCHLVVYAANQAGRAFWLRTGWYERPELVLMSADIQPAPGTVVESNNDVDGGEPILKQHTNKG